MADALPPFGEYSISLLKGVTYQGLRRENIIATQASRGPDFGTLRRAIEERDADTLTGFYSDDA